MSGRGIIGSIGRVLGYLLAIGLVATIVMVVAITFLQPHPEEPEIMRSARVAFARMRGAGGAGVPGVVPPSVVDRLAAQYAARVLTTTSQEVIMTGPPDTPCLGGDKEVVLEVKNDIGADQLDLSYSLENLDLTQALPPHAMKVASCGSESLIRQCIPLAPEGKGIRLTTLAYYGSNTETRKYPTLLDNEALKAAGKLELTASSFVPEVL